MAIGNINGVIRRKLGNMVGQSNALVNGKDKQVWRVYQGNVTNPKTIKQAQQRSLFVAEKNFMQAFKGILDHSWQGVEYGPRSLRHFSKLVLANGGQNFPNFSFQSKGSYNVIPQPWPISRGSLAIPGNGMAANNEEGWFVPTLNGINFVPGDTSTVGDWDKSFLDANPTLRNGDMITLLAVVAFDVNSPDSVTADTNFSAVYDRHVIDIENDTPLEDVYEFLTDNGIFRFGAMFRLRDDDASLSLSYNKAMPVAAGLIVSRQNGSKASWLRSSADMVVLDEFASLFNNNDYITAALDSFMASDDTATSDWYLNETGQSEATTGGAAGNATVQVRTLSINTAEGRTRTVQAAYYSAGSRNGYIYKNNSPRAYYVVNGRTLRLTSLATGESFSTNDIINVSLISDSLAGLGYTVDDEVYETPV